MQPRLYSKPTMQRSGTIPSSASDYTPLALAANPSPLPPPRLLDVMRNHLRVKHYALRTEQAYLDWARRFILFQNKRHPKDMGAQEVEAFLTYLAVQRKVSSATQNQALAALRYSVKSHLQHKTKR